MKGCIQLELVPDINNTVNMVPVDHVARIVSSAVVAPPSSPDQNNENFPVVHVTARPMPTYNVLFSALSAYGYSASQCEYLVWRRGLEQHVLASQDNALFPLLHFVLDDLPTSTKAPELDDKNARALLKGSGLPESATVDRGLVGMYLAWLVEAGFLPVPSVEDAPEKLPSVYLPPGMHARAVGRSGA